MSRVFADTCFWIALANKQDDLHAVAVQLRESFKDSVIYTTDECLSEFLAGMSDVKSRIPASDLVKSIRENKKIIVKEQSRGSFDKGLNEYCKLRDKTCSLVDCISFVVMREENITQVLSKDADFRQVGFETLMQIQ